MWLCRTLATAHIRTDTDRFEKLQQKIFTKVKIRFVFFSSTAVYVLICKYFDGRILLCRFSLPLNTEIEIALKACWCEFSHLQIGNGTKIWCKVLFKLQCCGRFQSSIILFQCFYFCFYFFFSFKVVCHILISSFFVSLFQ